MPAAAVAVELLLEDAAAAPVRAQTELATLVVAELHRPTVAVAVAERLTETTETSLVALADQAS